MVIIKLKFSRDNTKKIETRRKYIVLKAECFITINAERLLSCFDNVPDRLVFFSLYKRPNGTCFGGMYHHAEVDLHTLNRESYFVLEALLRVCGCDLHGYIMDNAKRLYEALESGNELTEEFHS